MTSREPLDLRAFAIRVGATAAAKGWDQPTWENLPGKLMLVVTEVDEAVESAEAPANQDYDRHFQRTYRWDPSELADIIIRTIDILNTLWPEAWDTALLSHHELQRPFAYTQPPTGIGWSFVRTLSGAMEYWRHSDREMVRKRLQDVVMLARYVALAQGTDLDAALVAKADINDKRPPLHGKKMTLG